MAIRSVTPHSPAVIPSNEEIYVQAKEPLSNFTYFTGPPQKNESGLWSSLALRFGGFSSNLLALLEPLNNSPSPNVARLFFKIKLGTFLDFSSRNVKAAQTIIDKNTDEDSAIWHRLLKVALGDRAAALSVMESLEGEYATKHLNAVADCAIEVANHKPKEAGFILRQIFSRANIATRLSIIGAFVQNDRLASNKIVGELFIGLMARSTPEERRTEIYPALKNITKVGNSLKTPKAGFLAALLRGWLSESPSEEIS